MTRKFLFLFILFLYLQTTPAVTIILDGNLPAFTTQTCIDIPPGLCCKAISVPGYCYHNPFNPTSARFNNLLITDIAAVWGRRDGIRDCSGIPIETRTGVSGSWYYPAVGAQRAYGASYIRTPTRLPPSQGVSRWLAAEGMLGLVWGGGKWFTQGAAGLGGKGQGLKRRGEGARRIIAGAEGTVYVHGPKRWRWPDFVMVNGTRYRSLDTEGLRYRSAEGVWLNATAAQETPDC